MSEAEAKRRLHEMLASFTAGSILHLLAEIFAVEAAASSPDDDQHAERCRQVEHALFVTGLGIDAAMPT